MTRVSIDNNWGDLNFEGRFRNNPSHLGLVVNELAKIPYEELHEFTENTIPFDIGEKIRYNDLGEYEFLIDQYCYHLSTLNDIYEAIDEILPSSKYMIRTRINQEYRRIRGGLLKTNKDSGQTVIDIIRVHSDRIIDKILKYLNDLINTSGNLDKKITEESIRCSLEIIVVDAFIECKILENPNGSNI